jgi:hypothetical protein
MIRNAPMRYATSRQIRRHDKSLQRSRMCAMQ